MKIHCLTIVLTLNLLFLNSAFAENPAYNGVAETHISKPLAKVLGQLKKVEDAGYPFVILTIEHAEGSVGEYTLNLEAVKNVNMEILNSWISSEVAFNYNSDIYNAVLDVVRNGHSIIYEDDEEFTEEVLAVEGILSGAEYETTGDVPGEFYVTTEEEVKYTFPFFINADIVAANGRKVIAYYEERVMNEITSIRLNKQY